MSGTLKSDPDIKLSVIVPVYNMAGEGKLKFCLDSLVGQTLQRLGCGYEILTVDDASTDGSLDILRDYEARYPGLVRVFVHEHNKRQGGAKNTGLAHARGEWIGFIDSDDWVTPDYYEKLLRRAEETGADIVGCDYNLTGEHSFQVGRVVKNNSPEQTGILDEERHKSLLMRPGSMVIKIYRHDVIREAALDFPEGIFYEDNCAGPVWSLYFTHFERVEEPMYYYYQHDTSTVHTVTEARCEDRMRAASELLAECKKRGALEKYPLEIEYRFTELYYAITLFSYMLGVRHPRLAFVRRLRQGVEEAFPDFKENPYYLQFTGEEEKYFISLQSRSDICFFYYYRLKLFVRRWKKRLRDWRCKGAHGRE